MTIEVHALVDWVAIVSLLVAVIALLLSVIAVRDGNRNSSCATLVTLNEGFRQAWQRFLPAEDNAREYELAELMNLFEIACAVHAENSFSGNSRNLLRSYLERTLTLLEKDEYSRARMKSMVESNDTFIFIQKFLESRSKSS